MRRLGESLRALHPTVLLKQPPQPGGGGSESHPAAVAFEVFSSNFARTQQSAQGLLHGLGAHELAATEGGVGGAPVPVVVREVSLGMFCFCGGWGVSVCVVARRFLTWSLYQR